MIGLATLLLVAKPNFGPVVNAFLADFPGRPKPVITCDPNLAQEEFQVMGTKPFTFKASSATGAAWGLLASLDEPKRTGRFGPKHAFRAVMIDVARRYYSLSTLRQLVRSCRQARVRYMQLHLTDDQNWMLPAKALAGIDKLNSHGRPAYTEAELKSLQKFASARGVTIIPEVEVPGHASLLVRFRPDLFGFQGKAEGNCINIGSEATRKAVKRLLEETASLFAECPYIHFGGDEASYGAAEKDPLCLNAMAQKGLKTTQELFVDFVADMAKHVGKLGKKPIVWEGFPRLPEIKQLMPDDLTVIAWEGHYYPPEQLSRDGFRVVNAGWNPFYVVNHYPYDSFTLVPLSYLKSFDINRFSHVDGQPSQPIHAPGGAMLCWWEGSHLPKRILAFGEALWPRASKPPALKQTRPNPPQYFSAPFTLRANPGAKLRFYGSSTRPTDSLLVNDSSIVEVHQGGEVGFRRLVRANAVKGLPIKRVWSNRQSDPDFEPKLAVDGITEDVASFWLAYPFPATLTLEIMKAENVSEIRVFPFYAAGAKTEYRLETSPDGIGWEPVPASLDTQVTNAGHRHQFGSRTVRFVRLTIEQSDQFPPTMGRIHEITIKVEKPPYCR